MFLKKVKELVPEIYEAHQAEVERQGSISRDTYSFSHYKINENREEEGMKWSDSPQGFDFWSYVSNKLCKLESPKIEPSRRAEITNRLMSHFRTRFPKKEAVLYPIF